MFISIVGFVAVWHRCAVLSTLDSLVRESAIRLPFLLLVDVDSDFVLLFSPSLCQHVSFTFPPSLFHLANYSLSYLMCFIFPAIVMFCSSERRRGAHAFTFASVSVSGVHRNFIVIVDMFPLKSNCTALRRTGDCFAGCVS